MLSLKEEKHLLYFDQAQQCFSSFSFCIKQREDPKQTIKKDENNQIIASVSEILSMNLSFQIEQQFTHQWSSQFYDLKTQQNWNSTSQYGKIPFSLETYFSLIKNPKIWKLCFVLKTKYTGPQVNERQLALKIEKEGVGKLIIKTHFNHIKPNEPFHIPVKICKQPRNQVNPDCPKIIKIIKPQDEETIVCSGKLIEESKCQKVKGFQLPQKNISNNKDKKENTPSPSSFQIFTYSLSQRVSTEHICILKHKLNFIEFNYEKITIKIASPHNQPQFIPILAKIFQTIHTLMQPEPLIIIQNIQTQIQDAHGIVFYSDLLSIQQRIFRSFLYDKIQDRWLIEGMISYTRSNKNFQDCMNELIELMTQGEELFPLNDNRYHFDDVWKAKARFVFYILANFKITRDYGSSSLVSLIIDYSKKKKINSTYLFRRLKKKYGLEGSFRGIYEEQFINSTGLNRIFYELIDIRRDNSVKYIVRQKSLANKVFKIYNLFRIKLQQTYNYPSEIMNKIIKKNKYEESGKKKDLQGALAVPQFLKCLPYFKGKVTVQSDASQPFQLELQQKNIIQKTKQSSSLKARPVNRKPGETQKGIDGFNWMMIDTAYVFPAVYKNENVHQNVILEKIKSTYESQQEEIKVLNCVSSRDHSENQQICKALLDKLKMQPKSLNTNISVKRKILQLIPIFINKLKDATIWQDYYALFVLYEPPCYDHSDEGFQFLLSLIESAAGLQFKRQFSYYFNQVHRILLAILKCHQVNSEEKQLKLKNKLFKALMSWKSKYSFEILKEIAEALKIYSLNIRNNLSTLKALVQNLLPYIETLQIGENSRFKELVSNIQSTIKFCVLNDTSGHLFAIQFQFEMSLKEKNFTSIQFLTEAFTRLEKTQKENHPGYWLCLKGLKNILNKNKIKYGLQIQLDELNEDKCYFLAEYLWTKLTSKENMIQPQVHLQWIKIYRIFYFYFTPIISLYKLHKNYNKMQFPLNRIQTQYILENFAEFDFIPDIRWFSGYDSSAAKQQKAKYEQYNLENNRRRRKHQELYFEENNIITRFIMENPGKDSWEDISREALNIIILLEEKKEVDFPDESEKYKKIVQGLKGVQNYLKRGNTPNDFTLEKVKLEAQYVLREFDEETQKLEEVFQLVENALESIKEQKRQKDIEKENQMKILIPKDYFGQEDNNQYNNTLPLIPEIPEDQDENENDEGNIDIDGNANHSASKRDKDQEEVDQLNVHRYGSIFDE